MLVQAVQSSNIGVILIIIPDVLKTEVHIADRPSDRPSDRIWMGTHIPHLLCRESYHLGSHFGTIWGWIGWVLGGFKMVFLWFLGLLKFVQNSPIKPSKTCYYCVQKETKGPQRGPEPQRASPDNHQKAANSFQQTQNRASGPSRTDPGHQGTSAAGPLIPVH